MDSKYWRKLGLPLILMMMMFTQIAALTTPSSITFISGRRNLLQINNTTSQPINVSDDDTARVDPLDNFKKYRGGYNLTNLHYWSSTVYTGIPGYAIGVLWLLCGVVYGLFILATTFCCINNKKRKMKKRSICFKHCYLWHILIAMVFTVLAIVASGLVLGANVKFHSKAKTVVDIIIDTADNASETIYNTTGAMTELRNNLEAYHGGGETSSFLNSTSQKLDVYAADIGRQARKNRRLIDKGLKMVFIIITVTISLNLITVIALSVSGVLRFQRALHLLIILCWILTTLCWLFFGLYFFLEKFSGDTCTALEDFQLDPYNNSLSSIVPCDELISAQLVLSDVSAKIYNLVNEVNGNIAVQQEISVQLCNPFSGPPEYQYQPENCSVNTTKIRDIPQVLKRLTCSDTSNGICQDGEPVSNSVLKTVEAYTNSIQDLLNSYPGIEGLVTCESVKDSFSKILLKHCKPLKRYVRMVWGSMVLLSITMMVLVLVWTTKAHHERKHHFSDGSVKPHFGGANMLESGTAKALTASQSPSTLISSSNYFPKLEDKCTSTL